MVGVLQSPGMSESDRIAVFSPSGELAGILQHCGARLLFYDVEVEALAADTLRLRAGDVTAIS